MAANMWSVLDVEELPRATHAPRTTNTKPHAGAVFHGTLAAFHSRYTSWADEAEAEELAAAGDDDSWSTVSSGSHASSQRRSRPHYYPGPRRAPRAAANKPAPGGGNASLSNVPRTREELEDMRQRLAAERAAMAAARAPRAVPRR